MWSIWKLLKKLRLTRPYGFLLLLMFFAALLTYSYLSSDKQHYHHFQYSRWNFSNTSIETNGKYLVRNSKCHMLSMNPYDPSIAKFVKKEKFETCSTKPRLTSISRQSNGSIYLVINREAAKHYKYLSCCWAAISRPKASIEYDQDVDSKISVGPCEDLKDQVVLNKRNVQVLLVSCRDGKAKVIYKNTHTVIEPERVLRRLRFQPNFHSARENSGSSSTIITNDKPLSVLMLGLDSVSRLNFYRTMPLTRAYFEDRAWFELRAYNKMGDNTFPNLMSILTGQNETASRAECDDNLPRTLDRCPMIWYKFRDVGYVTAYAEDSSDISTFNYLKAGFFEPPTAYYLRPYVLASEKLLKTRQYLDSKYYCTGPELSIDRIFDCARDFSTAFINSPYFGFFWTNSLSHESLNGPSLYDARFLAKLRDMESEGVMNDSMIVVLSDHGMRYGDIRETFVGWYEERLPFVYIWLPQWFRQRNPDVNAALLLNRDRLTSPYDVYETLRDVLQRAGGRAASSTGCPQCSSLFRAAPSVRSCRDAGITPHWCTCAAFQPRDPADLVVAQGANKFVEYVNNITEQYKTNHGVRLCSVLSLKRVIRVKRLIDFDDDRSNDAKVLTLFYLLELAPGGGKFEITVAFRAPTTYTILEEQVSRINLYGHDAICLDKGHKKYCQCRFNIAHYILKWF